MAKMSAAVDSYELGLISGDRIVKNPLIYRLVVGVVRVGSIRTEKSATTVGEIRCHGKKHRYLMDAGIMK